MDMFVRFCFRNATICDHPCRFASPRLLACCGKAMKDETLPRFFGRVSTNLLLPRLVLGSEGCLGIITAALVRVHPVPDVVKYQSVLFPSWSEGVAWMRKVAALPTSLQPASCRLMDATQVKLGRAVGECAGVRSAV